MRFCAEYVVDLNASRTAQRAGYSPFTVRTITSKLLTKGNISREIQKNMDERAARCNITCDRVLLELANIGLFNLKDIFDEKGNLKHITDMSDDTTRALSGIEIVQKFKSKDDKSKYIERLIKVKTRDKIRALELMGKHLGMFKDIGDELPDLAGIIIEAQQRALQYKRETEKALAQDADFEDMDNDGEQDGDNESSCNSNE